VLARLYVGPFTDARRAVIEDVAKLRSYEESVAQGFVRGRRHVGGEVAGRDAAGGGHRLGQAAGDRDRQPERCWAPSRR
jgi:hypothetical protein